MSNNKKQQKMNNVKWFLKEFAARITGDNNTAKGLKILRGADSALRVKISSLEGDLISAEDALERAKEKELDALFNYDEPVTDRNQYLERLVEAQNNLTIKEDELTALKEQIEFFKGKLGKINQEVPE